MRYPALGAVLSSLRARKKRERVEPAIGTLKRWSVAGDWTAGKPTAGQNVVLSGNWLIDEPTPALGSLTVSGYLRDDPAASNVSITATNIMVTSTGMVRLGSETARRAHKTLVTLTGTESSRATRYVADRTATAGTGNGRLSRLAASTGAVAETITVTWTSETAFSVSGSVSGSLGTGTVGVQFNNKIRFIAVAGTTAWAAGATNTVRVQAQAFSNNGVGRSIQVDAGGQFKLYGRVKTGRTRLAATMADGATSCTVLDATGWEVGDEIVIGPSDFNDTTSGTGVKRTITGISGNTISWSGGVTGLRWGVLQYATDSALSLTAGTLTMPGTWTAKEWGDTPKVLDERAVVINLTRDIVLQGADDSAWSTSKFGLHCMFMGYQSGIELDGVEFRRVGQAGALGRYPVHWHMASYNMPDGIGIPSDGTLMGLCNGQFMRNCSVHTSSQRMMVLHGTCGVQLQKNVGFDITGHAIFFEDSSEMYNEVTDNCIINVSAPTSANRLTESEQATGIGASHAGIWLTNPANTVKGNWVFNASIGVWNAFATRAFNLSQECAVKPQTTRVFEHAENIGACCSTRGMLTEQPPTDNLGTSNANLIFSGKSENGLRFEFRGNQVYKNRGIGYQNRVNAPGSYRGWVAADNETLDFSGQADHDVLLSSALLVGVSLNNGNSAETRAVNGRRASFVSYDEGLVVRNILAFNYTLREPPTNTLNSYNGQASAVQGGGVVRMGEYLFPVWTFTEYGNWKLINCNPGFMCTPANISGLTPGSQTSFTLGICRDVNGLFAGTPGKHIVWNDSFYTYGAANLADYTHTRAKVTDTVYMGVFPSMVSGISAASQYRYIGPLTCDRLDPTGTTVVGSWNLRTSVTDAVGLDHFKHFAAARGGVYRLGFNGALPSGTTKFVLLRLSMMQAPEDMFTIAVAWPGSTTVGTVYQRWTDEEGNPSSITTAYEFNTELGTPLRPMAKRLNNTGMTSKADVIADTTGLKYWQDTANDLVWVKVKGDLVWDDKRVYSITGKMKPNRGICLGIRSNVLPS